jgi:AcrR family transcriptional regulator
MRTKRSHYAGTASKRRQIVMAALDCFTEMGFVDTTMEDIRTRSGASNGSIYHHFKSKEQLAAAVYVEGIADYQKGLSGELAKHTDPRKGVYAIVRYHLGWVERNRVWARFLFTMRHADFMRVSEDSLSQYNRDFAGGLSKWLKEHVKKGNIRQLSFDMYVSLILGPCQEYARLWLARKHKSELEPAINEIAGAVWQGIRVRSEGGTGK